MRFFLQREAQCENLLKAELTAWRSQQLSVGSGASYSGSRAGLTSSMETQVWFVLSTAENFRLPLLLEVEPPSQQAELLVNIPGGNAA